jgi:Flp pilus assembly protein TadG
MMLKHRFSDQLSKLAWRFVGNSKGNVAVTFAIASLPMLVAIGCAVDYSLATRMKSKMQAAADAASVGAISQSSPGYAAAEAMSGNGSVAAGATDANNIFMSNLCGPTRSGCTNITGYSNLVVTPTVTKTGTTLLSVVNFTAQVPTTFLKVIGYQTLTISGTSSSSAAMSTYLDFYLTLDVSGSMGLPSTPGVLGEEGRLAAVNPDNFVQYPTGCTLACHFAPQASACQDDTNVTPPTNYPLNPPTTTTAYTQHYSTSSYCMGYIYSRLSQSALTNMINAPSSATGTYGLKQVPGLPDAMLANLNNSLSGPNSLITGNSASLPYSLAAATSCPTAGTDACIQLRLDAVGYAVTQLLSLASATESLTNVPNQFRIGLYPFIEQLYDYFPLTTSINGSAQNSSTINYAAANLATLLDTNMNANLGSGGTHIDVALNSLNSTIVNVGNGSSSTNTQPFVFLVTDGAQDPQVKGVPNGGWSGTNHATVLNNASEVSFPNACATLKNRGIIVGVLYIPYQPISPVNSSFAGDEDDFANANIPNIPSSLSTCASPNYFFTASTPQAINAALQQMFQQSLITAHITN